MFVPYESNLIKPELLTADQVTTPVLISLTVILQVKQAYMYCIFVDFFYTREFFTPIEASLSVSEVS